MKIKYTIFKLNSIKKNLIHKFYTKLLLNQTKRFSTSISLFSDTIENNRLSRNSAAVFKNVKEDKLTILETVKGKSGIYM